MNKDTTVKKKKATGSRSNGKAAPVVAPSFRDLKCEMEREVKAFRNHLVTKYTNFHGHDLRKEVSWYLEQMGIGIHGDLEQVKREERQRLIAKTMAKEAAASKLAQK